MDAQRVCIYDWFDVNNIEHLKAYKYLNSVGHWPNGFLPENNDAHNSGCSLALACKMANAWIAERLKDESQE